MHSTIFLPMRSTICVQMCASTICVPLCEFHYMRSTVCVLSQNPNVLDPCTNHNLSVRTSKSRSICTGSTYNPETVSKDETPQEAFILDSRTNQTPSVRTNHLRTHMHWIHVQTNLSLCALRGPSTLRLRSFYVPSTFRLRSVFVLSLLC